MIGDRGFSLIEGMLAGSILAIGLLALSGMQAVTLSRNVDANELTRVTTLATDIMDRIQFNRRNVAAYSGIDTSVACTISATAQPMARGDCDQWRALLTSTFAANITGLRGQVAVTATGPTAPPLNQNLVVLTMTWTGTTGANKLAMPRQIVLRSVVAPE
jgi:type IV pilus assembly protein PilV